MEALTDAAGLSNNNSETLSSFGYILAQAETAISAQSLRCPQDDQRRRTTLAGDNSGIVTYHATPSLSSALKQQT